MRKLPLVKYISKQVADALDADGIFYKYKKEIDIRKGQSWNDELDTLIHEYLHFLQDKYPTRLLKLSDSGDLNKDGQARMTRRICRLIVKPQYRELFK